MWIRFGVAGGAVLLGAVTFGCAPRAAEASTADLAPFEVSTLPEGVTRTYVDFGGKVHLVGYAFEPESSVTPGGSLRARLYWRRMGTLQPEWSLFTHVDDDKGRQLRNYDKVGPFRAALGSQPEGLARLALGKTYVDEQTLEIPRGREVTPRITYVVGVWHGQVRLPVVSGVANGKHAAAVASFETGVQRAAAAPPAPAPKEPRR